MYSSHCTGRISAAKCGIYDLEITATSFGLCVVAEYFPDRSVILRCDNRGATQTLVRGACKTEFSTMACATFWNLATPNGIPVWIEEVAGKLNHADPLKGL